MSGGNAEGAPPPPRLVPKTFQIFWSDNDRPVSDYVNVTGSKRENNLLMLRKGTTEFLINLDEVRLVIISDEVDPDE